jgi:hypothetical protein
VNAVAERAGPCAVCRGTILIGERIEYTLQGGPKHLTCADMPGERRRNEYRTKCDLCGKRLGKGAGALLCVERPDGAGGFSRAWRAYCVDVAGCSERIAGRM